MHQRVIHAVGDSSFVSLQNRGDVSDAETSIGCFLLSFLERVDAQAESFWQKSVQKFLDIRKKVNKQQTKQPQIYKCDCLKYMKTKLNSMLMLSNVAFSIPVAFNSSILHLPMQ